MFWYGTRSTVDISTGTNLAHSFGAPPYVWIISYHLQQGNYFSIKDVLLPYEGLDGRYDVIDFGPFCL